MRYSLHGGDFLLCEFAIYNIFCVIFVLGLLADYKGTSNNCT